jgi:hypothetical protein
MFDLDKLDELEKAATGGEWRFCTGSGTCECTAIFSDECSAGEIICDFLPDYEFRRDPQKDIGGDINFVAALRNAYPAMSQELRKLREIVAKLPKTADGAPVTPEMKLYRMMDHAAPNPYGITDWKVRESVAQMIPWRTEVTFYSTREAAEAAKK